MCCILYVLGMFTHVWGITFMLILGFKRIEMWNKVVEIGSIMTGDFMPLASKVPVFL